MIKQVKHSDFFDLNNLRRCIKGDKGKVYCYRFTTNSEINHLNENDREQFLSNIIKIFTMKSFVGICPYNDKEEQIRHWGPIVMDLVHTSKIKKDKEIKSLMFFCFKHSQPDMLLNLPFGNDITLMN